VLTRVAVVDMAVEEGSMAVSADPVAAMAEPIMEAMEEATTVAFMDEATGMEA